MSEYIGFWRVMNINSQLLQKRIFFLVSDMSGGGAERVAALLCNKWASQGHDVTLMATFSGRGECRYSLDESVKLEFLADRVSGRRIPIIGKFKRLWALRAVLKEKQPDAVISFLTPVNVATLLASLGLGLRIIVCERNYPPSLHLGFVWHFLRKLIYRRATLVVAQTEEISFWLQSECGVIRTMIIPNPVNYPVSGSTPFLDPDQCVATDRHIILAVGRLVHQKGFDLLINAYAKLADKYPNWDLVILGEGDLRLELEGLAGDLDVSHRVKMPGWAGNVADWYQRADIYVLSSRFEGFPNSLIEAMAYGLPSISINCKSGPAEIILGERQGILVDPDRKEEGLVTGLENLMHDEARRVEMGNNSKEVQSRYSLSSIALLWDRALGFSD